MRLYRIRNKKTGLFLFDIELLRVEKNIKDWVWAPKFYKESGYYGIHRINEIVSSAVRHNCAECLDDCEILAYQPQDPIEVKSGVKLPTVRLRHEQKEMIKRLKS